MKREILIAAALGEREPDLVLKNARVVNVFSGEVVPGDIAIADGMIAGVGSYDSGKRVVDLGGKFVAPGFIDAHVHVESSMVSPPAYCTEALGWGTTTLVTDPHEIANVAGGAGVRFMLDTSAKLPVNYYVQLPSCVPATPFEHAGEVFTAEKMKPFTEEPRVLGLGEMMNYPGVAGRDPAVMAKFELFSGRVVDGHAPGITGNGLQAYIAAGTGTDHESTSWAEAHEKLRAGLAVLVPGGLGLQKPRADHRGGARRRGGHLPHGLLHRRQAPRGHPPRGDHPLECEARGRMRPRPREGDPDGDDQRRAHPPALRPRRGRRGLPGRPRRLYRPAGDRRAGGLQGREGICPGRLLLRADRQRGGGRPDHPFGPPRAAGRRLPRAAKAGELPGHQRHARQRHDHPHRSPRLRGRFAHRGGEAAQDRRL